jgi:Lon-like protease
MLNRWAAWLPLVALALIVALLPVPYFVIRPGPAKDVIPLIHIRGHPTHPSSGHLLLTAVLLDRPNVFDAALAWVNKSESVVPERDVITPGQTREQEEQVALSEMDTSKIDAAIVALTRYAGYPRRHGAGVLVEDVVPNTPADGKLFAGDLIVKAESRPVNGPADLSRAIRAADKAAELHLTVGAGGKTRQVGIVPGRVRGVKGRGLGVSVVRNFPFPLTISSGDIGGPSAGLMWTLGLIELLTPGDLTRGRQIAGTGQIDPDGRVQPVGGVEQKVVAAERAGAAIFFAPPSEAARARSVARRIRVVPVRSYRDALRFLRSAPERRRLRATSL